jgi:hypothetical protein
MTSTISTTTTIIVAIMLLLTTHPHTWLGSRQAPLGRAAVSPQYQVDKHYDDYDNYSGYSETDGVSRRPYLLPHSSAQRTLRPTPRIAQRPEPSEARTQAPLVHSGAYAAVSDVGELLRTP